jgi:mannobiose 2-epimerase
VSGKRSRVQLIVAVVLVVSTSAQAQRPIEPAPTKPRSINSLAPTKANYLQLANDIETSLQRNVISVWFPRAVDQDNGGFYSNFTRDRKRAPSEGKFSVFQGRMTWVAAQLVRRRPDLKSQFLPVIEHGLQYLRDVMWDKQYGGFFWGLDDRGQITTRYTDGKHLYGMSFCLYGATAAYQATLNPQALELAKASFLWMDKNAHDSKNGGYFEWLTREGKVVQPNPDRARVAGVPGAGFPLGYKSMNTHIHLLESFTQLYEVWKNHTLLLRLNELLAIVRDKICVEPGVMNLYFTVDWQAIPDHDSYGHDVEAGYLLLETEEVIGVHNPKTDRMAKQLVDHALAYGWDETYGGFYREGTTFGRPEDMRKEWWAQMEGLNALLLMHEKHGRKTDIYFKAFQQQWEFIRDWQTDHEFGGFYDTIERDGTATNHIKARIWKEVYHDSRALLNVTERLRKLASIEVSSTTR